MGKNRKKESLYESGNLNVSSFLKRYYEISHEAIKNMTHADIKALFPELRRASFEYIQKNPELLATGKVILVEDVKHYQVPYFTPNVSTFDDKFLGCDDRERVIQEIVRVFAMALETSDNILFIIEGDDSLEKFAFQPQCISKNMLEEDLFSMMRVTTHDCGVIIKGDYSIMSYRLLNHGDNCYDTMVLPPLQRQAVGISKRTDAIGAFW